MGGIPSPFLRIINSNLPFPTMQIICVEKSTLTSTFFSIKRRSDKISLLSDKKIEIEKSRLIS